MPSADMVGGMLKWREVYLVGSCNSIERARWVDSGGRKIALGETVC